MLTKDDFIRHILGEAPRTKARATKQATGHVEGFDFADDTPDSEATEDTRFVTPLLQAGFGDGQGIPRATVIRSTDAVARYIPDEVRYWPKTPARPHHTLLIEANLTHRELLAIPAFKSRQLAHLDIAEDAVARLVAEALEGFQRGAEGLDASALKGQKYETLCVVSIIDEREEHAGRIACFGTFNAKTEGLETFFLTKPASSWDRAEARERLGLIYERQFKKLGEAVWQEAFTATDERKQAEKLLEVCTKKNVAEKDVQESILDLLDTIARGFGLRKKPNVERRLQAFPLPSEHDIGIDSEERENKYGGTNPFSGVTLRDDHSRLLGYIVYPLKTKADAEKLRQHLEKHNRFHNVLVVYPDTNQASIELWQGREQLTGRLRKGQSHKDAADVVNLLSRFFVVSKAKVRNPSELAQELAYRARYLRRIALKQLEDEPKNGPLRNLYDAFKVALVHDQKEDEFADAFAQTITYGLLTARWLGNEHLATTGERFTRQSALKHLPAASPFLNDLFKSALSVKLDEQRGRLLWLVDDVSDLLDRIDVTYVFGAGDKGSDTATDPVIHFYEPFLAAYDKELKNKRGVFFTPRPVVSYIVRSVHELLQNEFDLKDGLASTDTWGDVAKRIDGLKIPEGTKPSDPFVCILDPATGTGTFLYECIEVIEHTMKDRWCRDLGTTSWQDDRVVVRWSQYVANHLLPRLYGFELMMASYSVAHLKLSFKLAETGYSLKLIDRLHIYLTNTLEPASPSANPRLANLFVTLANEAQQVSVIKDKKRFTIVIGNPPYSRVSQNQSSFIRDLMRTYKEPVASEANQQPLDDDYIKFIRLAHHLQSQAGCGVIGLITNHTVLSGVLFRGVRQKLLADQTAAYVLDLHGNSNIKEKSPDGSKDENVFDILAGVGVTLWLRAPIAAPNPARCWFHELWGTRESKYSALTSGLRLTDIGLQIRPEEPYFFLNAVDLSAGAELEGSMRLPEIFPINSSGLMTVRDNLAIAFDVAELKKRFETFRDPTVSDEKFQEECPVKDYRSWSIGSARKRVRADRDWKSRMQIVNYRPFDKRAIFYSSDIVTYPNFRVMDQFKSPNLGLIASRIHKGEDHAHEFATREMVEIIFLSSKSSNNAFVFPLYVYPEEGALELQSGKLVNVAPKFLEAFASRLGLVQEGPHRLPQGMTAEDIFYYIYALLHSSGYRQRYAENLRIDFPVVPLTRFLALTKALQNLGGQLVALHLLEALPKNRHGPALFGSSRLVEKVSHNGNTVWIDKKKTRGFKSVDDDVWAFHVGGYQVCEKWLKDRKGRSLSADDVEHYRKIVVAISETIRIIKGIDEVIDKHGGWPGAFTTKASAS